VTGYRELPPAAALPLPGGRVYELGRADALGEAVVASTVGLVVASALGTITCSELPLPTAVAITLGSVVGAVLVTRLVYRALWMRSRWRLHLSRTDAVLERTGRTPTVLDVAHTTMQRMRHENTARGKRWAMPTVRIDLPDGRALVVTGPIGDGWIDLPTPPKAGDPAGAAPDVRLDDAAAFAALRKRAQQ